MDEAFDMQDIKGVTQDSRAVKDGYLFAAIPGSVSDGRDYIDAAIAAGASHILAPTGTVVSSDNVQVIFDDNVRLKFAEYVAEFYGAQPDTVVAVTGTNGKTSTAIFTQQLWDMAGKRSVAMGSLGLQGAVEREFEVTNVPETVRLHETLKEVADEGVTHLVMEAASHGLHQYRMHGVKVKVAGFTNLTQDHLDYHADMEEYFAAKMQLFTELLDDDGVAVLNADSDQFNAVKAVCSNVISYGRAGKDLNIVSRTPTAHGQNVSLEVFGEVIDVHFPLAGEFQLMNALCALGMVMAEDRDMAHVRNLEKIKGVPGRLQPAGGGVYVDYAHTPDALETVLRALKPHAEGRLICLVGCGGDRDKTKRPIMARHASEIADYAIITDDNPRTEDPATIRMEMIAGISKDNYEESDDRRAAIEKAVANLQTGDALLLAGKGHEQGQIFADRVEPFDDLKIAQEALAKKEK